MNAPTSSLTPAEQSVLTNVETEISKLAEQAILRAPTQLESDSERIRASVARLTSNSIDGLEGLSSELQKLQTFLNSEVQRVQEEIESALAGIKIIIDTIAPWKTNSVPVMRGFRGGPAATLEANQSRR
jgi:hypothetical protein